MVWESAHLDSVGGTGSVESGYIGDIFGGRGSHEVLIDWVPVPRREQTLKTYLLDE